MSLLTKKMHLKKTSLLSRAIAAVAFVSIGLVIPQFLTYSSSPSLGYHLFFMWPGWLVGKPDVIKKGDLVRFPHQDKITGGKRVHMLKRVACQAGDILTVNADREYYCNGQYLGRAKEKSASGVAVSPFQWSGAVPNGVFFAAADHKDSYDSRYYGFISNEKVENKAWPLF